MLVGTLLLSLSMVLGCGGTEDPGLPQKHVFDPPPPNEFAMAGEQTMVNDLVKYDSTFKRQDVIKRIVHLGQGGSLVIDKDEELNRILAEDFTLELWMKLDAASYQQVLGLDGLRIGVHASRVHVQAGDLTVAGPVIGAREWYHVMVVVKADTLMLFVNGILGGQARLDLTWAPRGSITVGGESRNESGPFVGDIDNLRVMSGALHDTDFAPVQTLSPADTSFSFDFNGTSRGDEVLSGAGHKAVLHGDAKLVPGSI